MNILCLHKQTIKLYYAFILLCLLALNSDRVPIAQAEENGTETLIALNAQTSTSTSSSQDICMIEGTVQISEAAIEAIKSAIAESIMEVNFHGAECFAAIDLRDEREWAFVTLVGLINIQNDISWTVTENGVWVDSAIIHSSGTDIHAVIAGTIFFSEELAQIPEEIVPALSKNIIDPLSSYRPELFASETYRFPFQLGYQVYYGTKDGGVHPGEFTAVIGSGSLAVDLMSEGNTDANHAPNRLLVGCG